MGYVVTALLTVLLSASIVASLGLLSRKSRQLARTCAALAAEAARRNALERQLRESEQKFQDVAELSGDWIWESDAEHRFTYLAANSFTERTGLAANIVIGKTRWELANGDAARNELWHRHKADLDAHRSFHEFRYAVMPSVGKMRYFVVSGKPVFDASGSFIGYRGTASDETARVEAQRRARQAETLLRDALDSLSEGFVIYDNSDRLVLCNEAYRRMYPASASLMVPGVEFETLVRNTLASGHYPEAAGHEEEWLGNFLRIHNEAVAELETQQADGRWILVMERRMRNGGLAGLRVDISELKQTQAALRDSERRLRAFAELASDWFWEQDADARFLWISYGATGNRARANDYIGRRRWELHPDGAAPEHWEQHKADIAARRPFRDFRYRRPNQSGRLGYVSIHGVPVFDGDTFIGYRGIGRDITNQIEVEQELGRAKERAEQAESLLRDAVESISEGFVIFDRDDRLVMHNEVFRQIYGDAAEILVPGVRFEDFARHVLDRGGNLDARGREEEWLAQRMRQHLSPTGQTEYQRADGKWYLATDRRMKNGGIAGLRIDITALKQAQQALRQSEERLDRAQAIAGVGSWELDVATKRYVWSKEMYRLRGLHPATFSPDMDNLTNYVHPDDHLAVRSWLDRMGNGEDQGALEPRIVRPDGEVRVLRAEARPIRDANGVVCRLAGTMQDITEQRLIERQLAQAQKMEAIGNLTGGMAHDFNNVLGVIVGNLELLQRLLHDDPTVAELCTDALQGASRCADLVRRLLAFARRQPLRPERTDANARISELAKLLRRLLGEDIVLSLRLAGVLPPVMADPAQLEAALVNFATNARDAMPQGGRLDIATSRVRLDAAYAVLHPDVRPADYVCVEIGDTGCGIPPEVISHVFEPFFTTKGPERGTGLGLSMAFGFAKQSGGHLTVDSKPGYGTTFRLYLPIDDGAAAAAVAHTESFDARGGRETVLVVEDNTALRRATVRQLARLGYHVLEAEHAEAALRVLSDGAVPDLLFTDVVMPGGLDGVQLADRAVALQAGLRVLLTSGFPGLRRGARNAECPFPTLSKPYGHDELARHVREVLDAGEPAVSDAKSGIAAPVPA